MPGWGYPYPESGASGPCGCCGTTPAQKILVICTFRRFPIVGSGHIGTGTIGNEQSVAALDGNNGNVLWYYDTGLTTGGTAYVPGRPLLDSHGNSYIPINGIESGGQRLKLLKLDKTGNLLWTYDAGLSNPFPYSAAALNSNGALIASGICFDTSGNIIVGQYCTDLTNFIYARKVDINGNHLMDFSTTGTGFPVGLNNGTLIAGGGFAGPVGSLVTDASNNLWWIAPADRNHLVCVNSSGTYVSNTQTNSSSGVSGTDLTTSSPWSLAIDKVNGKIFIGYNSQAANAKYNIGARQVSRFDIASLTFDWHNTLSTLQGVAGTLNLAVGSTDLEGVSRGAFGCPGVNSAIGYDSTRNLLFIASGTVAQVTPSQIAANFISATNLSSSTENWFTVADSDNTIADRIVGIAQAVDPVSGCVVAIIDCASPVFSVPIHPALYRYDNTSGFQIWSALKDTFGSGVGRSGVGPTGIAVASYS